jgi:hypothetical protein
MYPQATVSAPYQSTTYPTSTAYNNYSYPAYAAGAPAASYPAAAAPMNSAFSGTYDPEEEARIAEWNSAYNRDDGGAKKAGTATAGARSDTAAAPDADTGFAADGKRKTVVREGGGKQWEDPTLLEWNPAHPRLFIGNLAGEVTDESLLKAFSKYPSLSKARVVRDKRSTKSKSYGFVSFVDTDDFFRAAREMQGKYIGSHPVLIKRATAEVKAITKRDDKHGKHANQAKYKGKNNNANKSGSGIGVAAAAAAPAAPTASLPFIPRKVQKKGKAAGPRVLG